MTPSEGFNLEERVGVGEGDLRRQGETEAVEKTHSPDLLNPYYVLIPFHTLSFNPHINPVREQPFPLFYRRGN